MAGGAGCIYETLDISRSVGTESAPKGHFDIQKHHMTATPREPTVVGRTHTRIDWLHYAIVIAVFSITGSLSALFSRFLLNFVLGLDGGVLSGPWSYRIVYLLLIPPFHSLSLVAVGSIFGKHSYFKRRVLRMWALLLPIALFHRGVCAGRKLLRRRRRTGID